MTWKVCKMHKIHVQDKANLSLPTSIRLFKGCMSNWETVKPLERQRSFVQWTSLGHGSTTCIMWISSVYGSTTRILWTAFVHGSATCIMWTSFVHESRRVLYVCVGTAEFVHEVCVLQKQTISCEFLKRRYCLMLQCCNTTWSKAAK